jgi:diamine N-acetyltransferase
MNIFLRNLKDSDTNILLKTENDESIWPCSIQDKPFERGTIKNYIKNASAQTVKKAKQKRFVISSDDINVIGFIDVFKYDANKLKAFVGIIILDEYRQKGFGYDSIQLLEYYCLNQIGINKLYASIDSNNIKSIKLFSKSGFVKKNNELYEKILNE